MTSWRRWSRTDVADRTFARHGHDLLTLVWKIMQMHAGHRGYLSGSNYLLRCSRRKETADDAILTAAVWPRSRPYFYAKCLSVSAPRGQASQLSPLKSLWTPMNHLRQAAELLLQLLLLLQHPWLLFLLFLFYFSIWLCSYIFQTSVIVAGNAFSSNLVAPPFLFCCCIVSVLCNFKVYLCFHCC